MCRVCGVSRQGYYDWCDRPLSNRDTENRALKSKIRIAHKQSWGTYGSPRITAELRQQGLSVSKNRVARLMKLVEPPVCFLSNYSYCPSPALSIPASQISRRDRTS
jgi:hypothetical protein